MGAAVVLSCPSAQAELNVPIAWRVLSFLQPAPTGSAVAIIVEPGNAASEAEAASIERAIGNGASVGNTTVRSRRISTAALGSLASYRAVFVTVGTRASQPDVAAAASRASVVTITSDAACVRAGHCIVGITSEPRVQITVNRGAAKASNVRFGSAFLMLVKEI